MTCCGTFRGQVGTGEAGGSFPPGTLEDQFLRWNGTLWVPTSWTLPEAVTDNDLGEVLTVTAANVAEFSPLYSRKTFLQWGARSVAVGSLYLYPWQFNSASIAANQNPIVAPMSGRLSEMRVVHGLLVTSTDNITYTLEVNGAPAALTVTLNTGTLAGSNLVNVVQVGALDVLTVIATGQTASRIIQPVVCFTYEF